MNDKDAKIWERCKSEAPEKQFMKLLWYRDRLKEKGWKNAHVEKTMSKNGNIVIEAIGPGIREHKHWFQVGRGGDLIPLPCEMRCK